MNTYQLSKFTHFVTEGRAVIAFNLASNGFLLLHKELGERVEALRHSIGQLQSLHPELFDQMLRMGIIVEDGADEVKDLVDAWRTHDADPSTFGLIVNPTLGCNLRCWYCYEQHDRMPMMEEAVRDSICRLLDRKAEEEGLESMNVSFFGGEPLLGFHQVVMPILGHAAEVCGAKGIALHSNFTTNGVLLTEDVLDGLESVGLTSPATFQISLDGNREHHDHSRIGANRQPTYDCIVTHMKQAAARHHQVFARLNYTATNITSFTDVLDDFSSIPESDKPYIQFNFQQIWQDQEQNDLTEAVAELKAQYAQEGFAVESDHICHRHNCYADHENHLVVNYDGLLFKCTARDFKETRSEGRLQSDGEVVWNEKYARRMEVKYANKACLACKILPICNGGCSQNKLDAHNLDHCYNGMSEDDKDERILQWLKELIANHQPTNS